ncbi:MAG: hypothetical protein IPM24_04970 [Bryobacterales bacterium]|nr:hypothetical protein [Bryobacterales bacterium]
MSALRELARREPLLFRVGAGFWLLSIVLLAGVFVDSAEILGVNRWIKPLKFSLSIAIFIWTMAWFLQYLDRSIRTLPVIRWGIVSTQVVEIVLIAGQSARGVPSHFNAATPFDLAVFNTMGLAILANSIVCAWAFVVYLKRPPELPASYLWGIRCGLAMFLLGSAAGVVLVANNAHTVGLPDGGAGLPFLNWSTLGGDLRIAHFVGLHGTQAMAIAGYAFARIRMPRGEWLVIGFTLAWAFLTLALLFMALAGRPLFIAPLTEVPTIR